MLEIPIVSSRNAGDAHVYWVSITVTSSGLVVSTTACSVLWTTLSGVSSRCDATSRFLKLAVVGRFDSRLLLDRNDSRHLM